MSAAAAHQRAARGRRIMLSTGHPSATAAGLAVHAKGGTLVDAALAASAALTVLLPHATSIGGDLLALYYDAAEGTLHALDAAGTAPAAASPRACADGPPRQRGIRLAVVPGIARGWQALHSRFGRLPWRALFEPAVFFADSRYPLAPAAVEFFEHCRSDLLADPGCARLFADVLGGATATLAQPALAETLRLIAGGGADAFYRGSIARRLVAHSREAGGLFDEGDLADYAVKWREPLALGYRGNAVHVMPPSSYGLLLLLQLGALDQHDGARGGKLGAVRFAAQLAALRAAFAVGEPHLYEGAAEEPCFNLEALVGRVEARLCEDLPQPVEPGGGTACVVGADEHGNMAVLIQSVFNPFGSACADAETGVLLNNRMLGFTSGRNGVAPGRRPAHTLCPIIVTRDGAARLAVASPGGVSQTVTCAQFLNSVIDGGHGIAEAIDAPRWCLGRSREVLIEPDYPECERILRRHDDVQVGNDPYFFGSLKAVCRSPDGTLTGAADRRRSAAAFGY
ncbi:MAG: gamma-glutamyltransferase [Candidatus Eiseniibacteriota bacterium]